MYLPLRRSNEVVSVAKPSRDPLQQHWPEPAAEDSVGCAGPSQVPRECSRFRMREVNDRFLNVVRKLNRKKPVFRVQVVLSLFVDHADHVVLGRTEIFEDFIDLPKFKRLLMIFVSYADGELPNILAHTIQSAV